MEKVGIDNNMQKYKSFDMPKSFFLVYAMKSILLLFVLFQNKKINIVLCSCK